MDALVDAGATAVPRPVRVARNHTEFEGAATLELDTGALPFKPGQFVMLSRPGIGEAPISICGDPEAAGGLIVTVRDVGPVSHAIVSAAEGSWLGLRGPYGTTWPLGEAAGGDLLLLAGGLGMAALRAATLSAVRHAHRFERIVLLYGTRDPGTILFCEELDAWARTGVEVHVTVDAAPPGWTGHVGLVTALLDRAGLDPACTTAFVCGPEVMMRFCVRDLGMRGVPAERIHVSLERHMACGNARCGRCQLGPFLLCRDGPVLRYADAARALSIREL